jgi:hypothetical protein
MRGMPRLIRLLPQHPTNLAYISSRLLGLPIVLKTSESIWLYPVFAFVCYVSIHLEISATVVRSAPQELPIRIRITSFRGFGIAQDSVAAVPMRLMNLDLLFMVRTTSILVGRESSHLVLSR